MERLKIKKERNWKIDLDGNELEAKLKPDVGYKGAFEIVLEDVGYKGANVRYNGHVTIYEGGPSHLCGLQGFDPMLGDHCPGCDSYTLRTKAMDLLKEELREDGLII